MPVLLLTVTCHEILIDIAGCHQSEVANLQVQQTYKVSTGIAFASESTHSDISVASTTSRQDQEFKRQLLEFLSWYIHELVDNEGVIDLNPVETSGSLATHRCCMARPSCSRSS